MPESDGMGQSSASVITDTRNETEKQKLCADNPTGGFAHFLGDIYITAVENAPTADEKASQELNKYRQMPPVAVSANPLVWWKANEKKFPLLSVMSKQYLCIPATSVPPERVCSTAGDIVTAQRASLKPKHVDMLIFFKKIEVDPIALSISTCKLTNSQTNWKHSFQIVFVPINCCICFIF